ncbi:MAG: STAS domain-containing protein [Endozoicomonadaceae bacterium]|nr:STAS domain-containing protein [Endozoicomonadaceae bacterium]
MLSVSENKLSFLGPVTFQTAGELEVKGVFFIKYCQFKTIIVDLSSITAADSSALALMLSWYREATDTGIQIVFKHVPDFLLKLSSLCNVDKILFRQ